MMLATWMKVGDNGRYVGDLEVKNTCVDPRLEAGPPSSTDPYILSLKTVKYPYQLLASLWSNALGVTAV